MSCELPIIATNVGGFPLQIRDGINGFLVDYGDIKTLKEKILYLVENPDIRKKIGELNRKEVIEKYSWEETTKKVLELYDEVVRNKKINKKILFFIPNLSGGGAERVMSYLLKYFSNKFKVISVFFNNNHVYPMPHNCKIYYLDNGLPKSGIIKKLTRIVRLKRIIRNELPDMALSFLANNYLIISTIFPKRLNLKLIIAEHNTISYTLRFSKFRIVKKIISKILYRKADTIVAVSKGVKEDLIKTLKLSQEKVKVIYNPLDIDKIKEMAKEEINHPWLVNKEYPVIINVGRLIYQKGQDILLKAFKIVNEKIESRLIILGKGQLLNELKNLTKQLNIEDKVDFVGFQKNPFSFISKADVFVLSSRWEGFGNVLIEAMACGVPVISTDCPSGPNEIIENGKNGILVKVDDVYGLAEAILSILENKNFSDALSKNALKSVEKFDVFNILRKYEGLIL